MSKYKVFPEVPHEALHFVSICLMLASTFVLAQNPVPFVDQPLVPAAVTPGGAGFTLTVNGTGFVDGATVNWNGSGLATTLVSGSQLTAIVPAANIASANAASVTVSNPTPGGGPSNVQYLVVASPTAGVGLGAAVNYSSGGSFPTQPLAADVNGDGKLDLIVVNLFGAGNGDGLVGVLLGNGDGTFQPVVTYDAGGSFAPGNLFCMASPSCQLPLLAVADVNGDGKPDIVVASLGGGTNGKGLVGILLGNGDGTFRPVVTYDSNGLGTSAVAVADVNGDGKVDLLVANQCNLTCPDLSPDGSLSVLLGNGDGTFQPAVTYDAGNGTTTDLAVGDMNGDGKLDVLVIDGCTVFSLLCEPASSVGILLGNGDGTFQPLSALLRTGGALASSGTLADVNGDGKLDALVANGFAAVFLGKGDGTLQPPTQFLSEYGGSGGLAIGDVNQDGKLDIVMSVSCGPASFCPAGGVNVLLGNGNGTFQSPIFFPASPTSAGLSTLADLNGDGKLDMLVSTCMDEQCVQGAVAVLLNVSPTTIALDASPNPEFGTQTVTFSATVTPQGNGVPTGTVTLFDGTASLASVPLQANGTAVFATSSLAFGSHYITAVYNGDKNFGRSMSPRLTQAVEDFGFTILSPTSQTVARGQSAVYDGSVSQLGPFTQSVSFSCTGAPANSTCSISPNPAVVNVNGTFVSIRVVTQAPKMGLKSPPVGPFKNGLQLLPMWAGIVGVLLAGNYWRKSSHSRRWRAWSAICLLAIGTGLPACGGGGSGSGGGGGGKGGGGTPAGTYTLIVTGTFTSGTITLKHSSQATLIVN